MRALRAFTLVELLVVLALIALLLTIAVPRFSNSAEVAKEKVRAQNMATLRDAIDKFKSDQGRYPAELTELVQKHYLRSLPLDPVSGSSAWVPVKQAGDAGVSDIATPGTSAGEGLK